MLNLDELGHHIRCHLDEDPGGIGVHLGEMRPQDVADVMNRLTDAEAARVVGLIAPELAVKAFNQNLLRRRGRILEQLDPKKACSILSDMVPDQRVVVLREVSPHEQRKLTPNLSPELRAEAERLLQFPDTSAAGIMTTEFVSLDPAMTVVQALAHLRDTASDFETIYACWVIDPATKRLLGAISMRDLVMADPNGLVKDTMHPKPITAQALDDRVSVAEKISRYNLLAVPVLDVDGRVLGNVTVDDVIDVMIEKQTEDVLRMGAVEPSALDRPYLEMPFWTMVKKRAGWLVVLFLGEMLTATAMGYFEAEIAKAVVLALFVPLIISSGGNSGSQASTIVIRAMALKEVQIGDWWTIMRREVYSGLALGGILGVIGFFRIALWSAFSDIYGPHWPLVGLTVGVSLVGVVLWGTLSGSLLPLLLRWLGFDPATSSAPFVATLVDVTGLVIYFTVAIVFLSGTILKKDEPGPEKGAMKRDLTPIVAWH